MNEIVTFLCGFGGSFAIEVVTVLTIFEQDKLVFPPRYRSVWFYVVRLLVALIAGVLAVLYGVNNNILAVNIGAATPLIIRGFGASIPKGTGPDFPS